MIFIISNYVNNKFVFIHAVYFSASRICSPINFDTILHLFLLALLANYTPYVESSMQGAILMLLTQVVLSHLYPASMVVLL